jgi:hypothetical protein
MQGRSPDIEDNYKHQSVRNQLSPNPGAMTHSSGFESRDTYLASNEPPRGDTLLYSFGHSVGLEAQFQNQGAAAHQTISFGHDRPTSSSCSAAQISHDSFAASNWQHGPNLVLTSRFDEINAPVSFLIRATIFHANVQRARTPPPPSHPSVRRSPVP